MSPTPDFDDLLVKDHGSDYNWTTVHSIKPVEFAPAADYFLQPAPGFWEIPFAFIQANHINDLSYGTADPNYYQRAGGYDTQMGPDISTLTSVIAAVQKITSHSTDPCNPYFSDVANISFLQAPATQTNVAIEVGALNNGPSSPIFKFQSSINKDLTHDPAATFNSPTIDAGRYGDIWLNTGTGNVVDWSATFGPGSQQFIDLLHEIGHALGLQHPTTTDMQDPKNRFTVMLEAPTNIGTAAAPSFEKGLKIGDILALQHIYGSNDSTHSGNSCYGTKQGSADPGPFDFTVWDGGGTNVVDATGSTGDSTIDLRQGHYSSFGGATLSSTITGTSSPGNGNGGDLTSTDSGPGATFGLTANQGFLAICYSTIIQNAIGTSAASDHDAIIGNAWNNVLAGGAGTNDVYADGTVFDHDTGIDWSLQAGTAGAQWNNPNYIAPSAGQNIHDVLIGVGGSNNFYVGIGNDVVDGAYNKTDIDNATSAWSTPGTSSYWDAAHQFTVDPTTGVANNVTGNALQNVDSGNAGVSTADYSRLSWEDSNIQPGSTGVTVVVSGNVNGNPTYTVEKGAGGVDGTDTVLNVEKLILTSGDDQLNLYGVPAIGSNITFDGGAGTNSVSLNYDFIRLDATQQAPDINDLGEYTLTNFTSYLNSYFGDSTSFNGMYASYIVPDITRSYSFSDHNNVLAGGTIDYASSPYAISFDGSTVTVNGATQQIITADDFTHDLYGTDNGDTYNLGGAWNPGSDFTLHTGWGDDTLTVDATRHFSVEYKGGDDVMTTSFEIIAPVTIKMAEDIAPGDVTYAVSDTQANGSSSMDVLLTIADHGTLFIDNYNDVQGAGQPRPLLVDFANGSVLTIHPDGTSSFTNGGTLTTIRGDWGDDNLIGGSSSDTFYALGGSDYIVPGAGNDTVYGGEGNDWIDIDANHGQDVLYGGPGSNFYNFTAVDYSQPETIIGSTNAADIDTILLATGGSGTQVLHIGADYIKTSAGATVASFQNVDALQLGDDNYSIIFDAPSPLSITGGAGNAAMTGTDAADTLYGGSGNDTINGLGGNDTLGGGDGSDTINAGDGDDVIFETAGGNDVINGGAGNDILDYSNAFGQMVLTVTASQASSTATGTDSLTGIEGVRGTFGGDAISGTGSTAINLYGGEGNDTINVFNTGGTGWRMFGEDGSDSLTGDTGNDTLDGGAGADVMFGGAGNDTYYVDTQGDVVVESANHGIDTVMASVTYSIASAANVENLTLTGGADIGGTGNGMDNTITGNDGNNTLDGGAGGTDTLIGGKGNDVYIFDGSADKFVENAGEGIDEVRTFVSSFSNLADNVEILRLLGTANITGIGNAGDNIIYGNSGNNLLRGLGGNDTLYGGAGNDTYIVDSAGAHIVENHGEGTDLVQTFVSYTLSDEVENLTLLTNGVPTPANLNINGTGNALGNIITGNAGDNIINGAGGDDTLLGGLGNDTYRFGDGDGHDVVTDTGGNDTIKFDSTVSESDATFTQSGNDLIIHYGTGDDQVTVTGYYASSGTGVVEQIVFNHAPVAQHDAIAATEDTALTGNVLADNGSGADSDPDGDVLSVVAGTLATAQGGSVALAADGSFTYTPAANFNGADSFSYTALDGWGGSANGTVDITVAPVNDPPVAKDDSFAVSGGAVLTGNVLADNGSGADSDVDGDPLSVTAATLSTAGGGSVSLLANGSFTYTPASGFTGADIFAYTLLDGQGGSATGAVNIAVGASANNPPVAQDDSFTAAWGTAFTGNVLTDNGHGADTDADNDTLQVVESSVTTAQGFVVGLAADGHFSFTPPVDFVGSDSFSYTVSDGHGGTDTASVTLNVTAPAGAIVGTSGADNLTGTSANNIIFGLDGDDVITASGGNDTVYGGAGNDTLDGGNNADMLSGGSGNDTYVVNGTGDVVVENLNGGTDTVQSSISYTLAANVENLILTGAGNLRGTGNDLDNHITGNSGNNSLDGGLGADSMAGGLGNDTYVLDQAGDTVTEAANAGIDTVKVGFSYTLGDNLENLTLTGAGDFSATGNDANNTILGNSGNNIIDGGVGADIMKGGLGNDTYYVDNVGDVISDSGGTDTVITSVSYTLSNNGVENLILAADGDINGGGNNLANTLTGNNHNNILTGSGGIDTIYGMDGNDTLNGNGGADILIGGGGDDTYVVDSANETLTEDHNSGTDTVQSSVTWTLGDNFENLTLIGTGNIKGTGNADDNIIIGNSGNNSLDGGGGHDSLLGGLGDDTYMINSTGVTIIENGGEGTDTVKSTISYTLDANVENLTLTGTGAINGTGNDLDNVLTGNSAANTLSGLGGNDVLNGGGANDQLLGGDGNDTVFGNGGVDTIDGGNGNDVLYGQAGADTLTGGLGADTFVFQAASAFGAVDKLTDFSTAQGDKLDIADILTGFGFNGSTMHLSDWMHLTVSAGNTTVSMDRDGLGTAYGFTNIATLNGVTGLPDVDTMVANGTLVISH